jgi:hypothetical protein
VPSGLPGTAPDPKVKYLPSVNQEASAEFTAKAQEIAKQLLK